MEYGPEIEVNGKRPAWLADDDMCHPCWGDDRWYHDELVKAKCVCGWDIITKICLPANHWAYPVLEKGYWPWAGGDKAPDDWDGGDVLRRNGGLLKADWVGYWQHRRGDPANDIIGYKRGVERASEPDTNSMVDLNQIINNLKVEITSLEYRWADAIAKYPDLAPVDPYLKRAREILADECGLEAYSVDAGDWDETSYTRAIIRALKEGAPTSVSKPCTLTPEELAQWRLEQAREIVAGVWNITGTYSSLAVKLRHGEHDDLGIVQSALAALTEYNITPETVK